TVSVTGADFDRGQSRQHTEGIEGEAGNPAHPTGMTNDDAVKPTDATGAAGGGSILAADLPDAISRLIMELRRERAVPNPGSVRFGHTDHLTNLGRSDAGTDTDPASHRIGGGDKGIGPL